MERAFIICKRQSAGFSVAAKKFPIGISDILCIRGFQTRCFVQVANKPLALPILTVFPCNKDIEVTPMSDFCPVKAFLYYIFMCARRLGQKFTCQRKKES